MWARIRDAYEKEGRPPSLDVVIQDHIERGHSGALTEIHHRFPTAPIYCTQVAAKGLQRHYASLDEILSPRSKQAVSSRSAARATGKAKNLLFNVNSPAI